MTNSGLARGKDQRHEIKISLRSTTVLLPVLLTSDLNQAFGQGNNLVSLQTNIVKVFAHIYSKQDLMRERLRRKILLVAAFISDPNLNTSLGTSKTFLKRYSGDQLSLSDQLIPTPSSLSKYFPQKGIRLSLEIF